MRGEVDRGRELFTEGRQYFAEANLLVSAGGVAIKAAMIESDVGNLEAAEGILREGLDLLESIDDKSYYPTLAVSLAEVLLQQHRFEQVPEWLDRARATTGADDIVNFIFINAVGSVLSLHMKEGTTRRKRPVVVQSSSRARRTTSTPARSRTRLSLRRSLAPASTTRRRQERRSRLEILDAKGYVTLATRIRERLAAVGLDAI